MSVARVVGVETEYGIIGLNRPNATPMALAAQLVTAYANEACPNVRWDYQDEDPLADARGWHMARAEADPSELTNEVAEAQWPITTVPLRGDRRSNRAADEPITNALVPNGARFYVDHAHPEYSAPEAATPREVVRWDMAGEIIANRAIEALAASPGGPQLALYKNNTDGKGASYGSHENYLVDRDVPFDEIVEALTPFLVTRQILCGAGRVGLGPAGEEVGFQLSQRADFIEEEVGLETTIRRPIINTRDEPHADKDKYRRLHVIVGDANQLHVSTLLKVGTTNAVLWLLEHGPATLELAALRLADPVYAFTEVSRDLTLERTLDLEDGREKTAIEIQRAYLHIAEKYMREAGEIDPDTAEVLERWASVLDKLEEDPMLCAREVEWVAKYRLLNAMRLRAGADWGAPKLAAADLQWADIRPAKSLYRKLLAAGQVEELISQADIEAAAGEPPTSTRAYFRGQTLKQFGEAVVAANWDSLTLDIGAPELFRIPTAHPGRGTKAQTEALFQNSAGSARDLIQALQQPAASASAVRSQAQASQDQR